MLTSKVRKSIRESVLCWLATVDESGMPNVSPKEMFVGYGKEKVLIANIASPESIQNVKINPNVCVSFVHVFKQKGFKLKGTARIIETGDSEFELYEEHLRALGGDEFEIKSIFEMTIARSATIVAPSYWVFSETTEESQVANALKTYGYVLET